MSTPEKRLPTEPPERPEWSRTRYAENDGKRPMNDLERIVWLLNRVLDKLEVSELRELLNTDKIGGGS